MADEHNPMEGTVADLQQLAKQRFDTHQSWVTLASRVLTAHPRYNEGINYMEPHPFKAVCFDNKGRLCRNGGDMARARDESAFPVYWLWPDQIGEVFLSLLDAQSAERGQ